MANSTSNLTLLTATQADKEATANELLNAASQAMLFAYREGGTSGTTWGFFGGDMLVDGVLTEIANGTVAGLVNGNNFVEATRAGAVSSNTTSFTAGRIPLFEVTVTASVVASWIDRRCWVQPLHIVSNVSVAITTADVTLSAAQARVRRVVLTGALTGNRNLVVPDSGEWLIDNQCTGAFTVVVKTAAGTGVIAPRGKRVGVYADGTNVVPLNAGEFYQAIAYAATLGTIDAQFGERLIVGTLTGGTTVPAPTNPQPGQVLEFAFLQDGTGGRVVTWNAAFKKAADGAGTANQRASTRFLYDGTNWIQQGGVLTWYT
jgi:hypothetical protein